MPQLDAYWIASQVFWLFLTFAALYVVMVRAGLPRLGEVLQDRKERIADDLEAAEHASKESAAIEEENQQQLRTAKQRAQEIVLEMQKEADQLATVRNAELDQALQRKAAEAQAEMDKARKEALAKVAPLSADLTQAVLSKVAGLSVPREKIEQVVQHAMRKAHV